MRGAAEHRCGSQGNELNPNAPLLVWLQKET